MRKPDEPGGAGVAIFNIIYGLGCVAVLILAPIPHWGSGWLLPVGWTVIILFLIINIFGVADSW